MSVHVSAHDMVHIVLYCLLGLKIERGEQAQNTDGGSSYLLFVLKMGLKYCSSTNQLIKQTILSKKCII